MTRDEMKMHACMPLLLSKSLGDTRDQDQIQQYI